MIKLDFHFFVYFPLLLSEKSLEKSKCETEAKKEAKTFASFTLPGSKQTKLNSNNYAKVNH
jgi:hypothetical protein